MGYKKQLSLVIKKFNALKEVQKEKIKEIQKSEIYAEAAKPAFINKVRAEAKGMQQEYENEARGIIAEARKATLARKKTALKDQNFNIQLSNALSIINTVGKDMSTEELKALVEPFKEDYNTIQILRKTVAANDIKGQDEIFGHDYINSDLEVLDSVEKEIGHVFFKDIDEANTMSILIAMNYFRGSDELEGGYNE